LRHAFTLIELLVVIALLALLVGLVLPTLGASREAGRAAGCLANLRGIATVFQSYADVSKGLSPALGQPYVTAPNWAVVVQQSTGMTGDTANETMTGRSALSCLSTCAFYGRTMTRTYAVNATGLAGSSGDRANYDDAGADPARPSTTHIRMELVVFPSQTPLLVDSAAGAVTGSAPPPTRCASVLDFRNAGHVPARIGYVHARGKAFQAARFDTSAHVERSVLPAWLAPLP
jgi:prepilin-type N-terminal cleavage/methylation domain-containing protein